MHLFHPLLGRCWDAVERWEILWKQFHLESGWYRRGKSSAWLLQIVISALGVGGAGKRFLLPSKPGLNKLNVLLIRCLKWIFSLNASDTRFLFNLNIVLICIYFFHIYAMEKVGRTYFNFTWIRIWIHLKPGLIEKLIFKCATYLDLYKRIKWKKYNISCKICESTITERLNKSFDKSCQMLEEILHDIII